jgi:YD repeat-containing protein
MMMRYMHRAALCLAAVLGSYVCVVHAQTSTPEDEYKKLIRVTQDISPLGENPFGEHISLYTGALSFQTTDISIPGNGPTIELSRSIPIDGDPLPINLYKPLADWDIDTPRMTTLVAKSEGWIVLTSAAGAPTARCSQFDAPPEAYVVSHNATTVWDPEDWWNGVQMIVPGEGSQDILPRAVENTNAPQMAGMSFPLVTNKNWAISCLASTANGQPGEGFLAVAPNGTKYWFNFLVYRDVIGTVYPAMTALQRQEADMLVTRVEDRFGNAVTYSYAADGTLNEVDGSDGRKLTLTYTPWQNPQVDPVLNHFTFGPVNLLQTASIVTPSGTKRTWTYNYGQGVKFPVLSSVVLPDGSSWSYAFGSLGGRTSGAKWDWSCDNLDLISVETGVTHTGTVVHPSGLVGTFSAQVLPHGRSYVPKLCTYGPQGSTDSGSSSLPKLGYTTSITSKTITGAGLSSQTWSYGYSGANASWVGDCAAGCASTVTTDETDPDGRASHYTFSNRFDESEGRLLTTEFHNGGLGAPVVRAQSTGYASPAAGPYPAHVGTLFGSYNRMNIAQLGTLAPQSLNVTTQDGDTYTWQAETFDVFAQPVKVKRFSSVAGQSAVEEQTTYVNDLPHWVLGLPAQLDNLTTGETVSHTDYDLSNVTPTARYSFGQKLMSYAFNAQGQLGSFTDGNSHTTTLGNYKRGIPQAIGYPDGTSQNLTVDDFGQITFLTNQAGANTAYQYDGIGRLSQIGYTGADGVAWNPKSFVYQFVGSERGITGNHWRRTVNHGQEAQVTYFDAMLRPILTGTYRNTDGAMHIATRTDYDWKGNKTFVSYPVSPAPDSMWNIGGGVVSVYDALGRAISSQQLYTEFGTLTTTTAFLSGARKQVTDPHGYVTTTAYQVFDQPSDDKVIQVLAPEGVTQAISRDLYGNPLSITQGGNGVSITKTMTYDANKRLCRTTEPESGSEVMAYDAANNLAWSASGLTITGTGCGQEQVAAAAKTTRNYDPMNRVLSVIYPTGTDSTTFTYDPLGNPATATSGLTSWTYGRNHLGLLTAEVLSVEGYQWSLGYGYDLNANLSTIAYPDGKIVSYAPDALGRATQVSSYANGVGYFADGDVQNFTFGNGATYVAEKNARNILSNFTYGKGGALAVSEDLAYDQNANISQITDLTNNGQRTKVLSYDQLNRLTSATASNLWGTESYTYDTLNNIRSLTNSGGTNTYNYNTNNLLQTVTNGATTVHAFQYDPRGNTINKNNVALTFDQANRLTAIQGKGTYLYDAAGRRVKKLQTGATAATYYAYSQAGQLMFQYDPSTDKATDYLYLGKKLITSTDNIIAPTASPVLSGPASSSVNTAYTLSWTSVPGATTYLLEEQVNGAAWNQVSNLNQLSQATQHTSAASYGYRVSACNTGGCGLASNLVAVSVLPPPSAPNAPASITATPATDRSSITVTWAASTGATNYVVLQQVNGGSWQPLYSGAALSTVLATPNDGTFAFQVQACSANGCSVAKGSSAIVISHIPPTPASINVPATSTGLINVSWATSTYATSYTLQQSVNGGAWTTVFTNAANGTILNEGASASYTLRAQACNASGCSGFVTSPAITVMLTPGAPGLSAPASSNSGTYTVSWNLVANGTSYNLQEQVNGGGWTTIQVNGGTSWSTSGKGNGTYGYYVQSCNALSCGPWSNIVSVAVALIPATPTNVKTMIIPPYGKGRVQATWTASPGATYYWVQVTTGATVVSLLNVGNVTSVAYTYLQQMGNIDTYSVQACNPSGCSAWSGGSSIIVQ